MEGRFFQLLYPSRIEMLLPAALFRLPWQKIVSKMRKDVSVYEFSVLATEQLKIPDFSGYILYVVIRHRSVRGSRSFHTFEYIWRQQAS
jgi:hypothetical protein